MAKISAIDNASSNVKKLIFFAQSHLELDDYDAVYVHNQLLDLFKLKSPYSGEVSCDDVYSVLDGLFDYAVSIKLYQPTDRLLFEGKVMGMLMPRPSQVVERFDNIASYNGSMQAAKWLQRLEESATYLRRPDLDKNVKWQHSSNMGDIIVTVNLAKPEKSPEEIERARLAKTDYPQCILCYENLGFAGNAGQPARQHIRTIPIELNGEDWFMQFSPYEYFDEHIIAISRTHKPMSLSKDSFERMTDFLDLFPDYFIGSNAPLPIVGGSVLAHEHYQGGKKVLPVLKRPTRKHYLTREFPDVNVSIVDWYNSVVRLTSKNRKQIIALAEKFRSLWEEYSNESIGIIAKTAEQHNTVTPVAYVNDDGEYAIVLILRNNRTDDKHPCGIFHPTEDMHNIKKEGIGIIEAMGLFILPGRLADEMNVIKDYLTGKTPLDFGKLAEDGHPMNKHLGMIAQLAATNGVNMPEIKAQEVITDYINTTCERILNCTAVFKNDEQGQTAFDEFVTKVLNQ